MFVTSLEKNIPIWNSRWIVLDLLTAGSENLALNSRSSLLALQCLVQQRHFVSSNEQVPVVQSSESSCTTHPQIPRSDPLKTTTKRGTRGKDRSKKNYKLKADKIIALRCELIWKLHTPFLNWNNQFEASSLETKTQSPSAIVHHKIERSCPKRRKGLSFTAIQLIFRYWELSESMHVMK